MRDTRDELTFIKIESTGFTDLCNRIAELEEKNEFLQSENKRLLTEHRDLTDAVNWEKRQNAALKFRCSSYRKTINELESEIADMKFTNNFLSSEDAGKMFARSLGVGQ
jgi:chromosome segregation ATPase